MNAQLLLFVFVVLQVLDYETTERILARGGREFNPFVNAVIDRWGMRGFATMKLATTGVVAALACAGAVQALAILCVIFGLVIAWNAWQLRKG